MRIPFQVSGQPAQFSWSNWTGHAELQIDGRQVTLQSPLAPSTHYSLDLIRVWRLQHGEHTIEIEKERPQLLAGFRKSTFTVRVDDEVVAHRTGR